jgi:hypothetical protein
MMGRSFIADFSRLLLQSSGKILAGFLHEVSSFAVNGSRLAVN